MALNLLATKLYRPSLPGRRVRRSHLVEQLNAGLAAGRRLTLVSAPAGFGKTSCVCEWLDATGLPVAWLSLEPADDDPGRFFAYLLGALQGVDGGIGRELAGIRETDTLPPIAALITALVNDFVRVGVRFVLALDDFHAIRDPDILDALGRLIAGGPDNMHLVLITREDPLLPLARLRANNQLTEVRAADLRFNSREAAAFLNELMDLSLSEPDIAALESRTEGWIAGLQLAGLSMRGRSDPSSLIAGLSGSHHYILSYLTEEVLDRQPPDVRSFLLQTSILDRLNGELCEAVVGEAPAGTESPGSGAILERLYSANLFLIPLDDEHKWYRYHHLFAHLLTTRLRQTLTPAGVQALHSRASAWFERNDQMDDAIRHALAAQDFERAVALVEQVARTMIFAGRMNTLRSWLSAFPPELCAAYPRLGVYQTWIDLLQGKLDFGEKAMQEREQMLQALPPSPENDRLRVELAVILCRYSPVFGDSSGTIRLAQEALRSLPENDLVTRARLLFAVAVAYMLEGDVVQGEAAFDEALRLARSTGDYGLAVEIMDLVAQTITQRGRLSDAARHYQEIIDLGKPAGTAPFYLAGVGYIGLAGIHLERNELDRAEACLAQGTHLCTAGALDYIYAAYSLRSRLLRTRGDLEGALAELDALEQAYRREDDPRKAAQRISVARAKGDLAALSRWAEPWMRLLAGKPGSLRPTAVVLEIVKIIAARVHWARGEYPQALALLDDVRATAESGRRFAPVIEVCLLKALALAEQGGGSIPPEALESLARALELAEPEGYRLLFLEEGPALVPLLRAVLSHPTIPERHKRYARSLLDALPSAALPASEPAPGPSPQPQSGTPVAPGVQEAAPVELLTERELEILRLIGEGWTNEEIAGRLVITLHTVKKHSSNIFGKLGVSSRTQAVARARRLGLMP